MPFLNLLSYNGGIPYLQIAIGIFVGALVSFLYTKFCRPSFIFGRTTKAPVPSLMDMVQNVDAAQKVISTTPKVSKKNSGPPALPDYPVEALPKSTDTFARVGGDDKTEDLEQSEYHQYEPFEPSDAMTDDSDEEEATVPQAEAPTQFHNLTGYTFITNAATVPKDMLQMNNKISEIQE